MILVDKMGFITAATTTSEITVFFVGGCIGIALIIILVCAWNYFKRKKVKPNDEGHVVNKEGMYRD
jgi:protein-S-isoprenylcysteine O-methyltransferase Ste14